MYVLPITWTDDPHNNSFSSDDAFLARLSRDSDFYSFKLVGDEFSKRTPFDNPLSNTVYRVVLKRPSHESQVSKLGTLAVVFVLFAGAVGAGWDLRRRPKVAAAPPPATISLDQESLAIVRSGHADWTRPLNDADVLWCDRNQIEEIIEDLKTRRLVSYEVGGKVKTSVVQSWAAKLSLPFGKAALSVGEEYSSVLEMVADPAKVPTPARLSALLRLMIARDLLSAFAGRPLEWDALGGAFSRAVGAAQMPSPAGLLNPQDQVVRDLASNHFVQVIKEALGKSSLFRAQWTIGKRDQATIATASVSLPAALAVGRDGARAEALRLEFEVPAQALSRVAIGAQTLWLMGKILSTDIASKNGANPTLCLRFAPVALLADADTGGTFTRRARRG